MQHIICHGDYILYSPVKQKFNLHFGDIAIYHNKHNQLVAHRYFLRFHHNLIFAGDNCRHFEVIPVHKLCGKVFFGIHGQSKYDFTKRIFLRTLYTLSLFIIIPIRSLCFSFIMNKTASRRVCRIMSNVLKIGNKCLHSFQKILLKKIQT